MIRLLLICLFCLPAGYAFPRNVPGDPPSRKLLHAEPLYTDLIRDPGSRKGARELNLGWKTRDKNTYLEQGGFIEYEFSPVNRLGLEVELPFRYHFIGKEGNTEALPRKKIESVKLGSQYTLLVSERHQSSVALGLVYELGLHSFYTMKQEKRWSRNQDLHPFLVLARRLGQNWHSLIYTGPHLPLNTGTGNDPAGYETNLSLHYNLTEGGHFIGLETHHLLRQRQHTVVVRPQAKLRINSQAALGLVTSLPLISGQEGFSFLLRLIYECR